MIRPIQPTGIFMVLTTAQAKALYDAMLACNDVGATFVFNVCHVDGFLITVAEDLDSWAVHVKISDGTIVENYENQAAFALAYGVSV